MNEIPVYISGEDEVTKAIIASKGPEYNVAILPFVKNIWNIDEAMKNSDSLSRMVLRLKRLSEQVA